MQPSLLMMQTRYPLCFFDYNRRLALDLILVSENWPIAFQRKEKRCIKVVGQSDHARNLFGKRHVMRFNSAMTETPNDLESYSHDTAPTTFHYCYSCAQDFR